MDRIDSKVASFLKGFMRLISSVKSTVNHLNVLHISTSPIFRLDVLSEFNSFIDYDLCRNSFRNALNTITPKLLSSPWADPQPLQFLRYLCSIDPAITQVWTTLGTAAVLRVVSMVAISHKCSSTPPVEWSVRFEKSDSDQLKSIINSRWIADDSMELKPSIIHLESYARHILSLAAQ